MPFSPLFMSILTTKIGTQQLSTYISERTTRSRSQKISRFAHSTFVASFEPKDIGHALCDSNWVNIMHEELENF
jgi:hypothetical protein